MCARFGAGITQGEHARPRSGMRQRTLETRCGLAQVEHVLARSFQNRGNEGCCSHTQMLTSVHKRGVDNNVQDGSANERGVFLISIPPAANSAHVDSEHRSRPPRSGRASFGRRSERPLCVWEKYLSPGHSSPICVKIRSCPESWRFTTPRKAPSSLGRSWPTASLKPYQYPQILPNSMSQSNPNHPADGPQLQRASSQTLPFSHPHAFVPRILFLLQELGTVAMLFETPKHNYFLGCLRHCRI